MRDMLVRQPASPGRRELSVFLWKERVREIATKGGKLLVAF
ncbi:hypothetical protein J31TS4_37850 [Paenibacillus sp. J31TS4]|nr:hypothetical protein J31TS4_37850 [Paenibacillus sp. J31TS4]